MTIQTLHIAKCGKCGLYPAPDSSPRPAMEEIAVTALRSTPHDAVALAVLNGWSAYPLLCPICTNNFLRTLRGDPDDEQGRGSVPEPGEGSERPGSGG